MQCCHLKYMVDPLEKQLDNVDFPDFQIFLLNSKNTMVVLIDILNGAHSDDTYASEVRICFCFHFNFSLPRKAS